MAADAACSESSGCAGLHWIELQNMHCLITARKSRKGCEGRASCAKRFGDEL